MSKGSGRRPASVSDAELAARWQNTFPHPLEDNKCDLCAEPLNGSTHVYQDATAWHHRDAIRRMCRKCARTFG